jgi:arylsulfatase A-like enzyme
MCYIGIRFNQKTRAIQPEQGNLFLHQASRQMKRRDFLRLMGSGAALAIMPSGCSKDEPAATLDKTARPPRHVIVISLDTARADFLGCYGNPFIKTPYIDRLAEESILFTDCMTVVPTTLASHTALFTGKYPHNHGTPRNGFVINEKNIMLAEILKNTGYHTAGFLGSFALDSRFDFSQGFEHYNEEFEEFIGLDTVDQNQRPAQSVTDAIIDYLDDTGVPDNLFLFAHYFDPHGPYTPPVEYCNLYEKNQAYEYWLSQTQPDLSHWIRTDGISAICYAGEMTYMDEHVGRLIDYLTRKGILEEAVVIVTSDHGENFKEHYANWDHGYSVYQTTMQSICLFRLPGAIRAGARVDQLFSNIDIFPTLLKYLGLDIPAGIDGEAVDLDPAGQKISMPARMRFGEATKPHRDVETDPRWFNNRKARCVRSGKWKYIQTPYKETDELYDLSEDPYEQANLLIDPSRRKPEKAKYLKEELQSWTDSANPLASQFVPGQREETIKRLKSLGYLK